MFGGCLICQSPSSPFAWFWKSSSSYIIWHWCWTLSHNGCSSWYGTEMTVWCKTISNIYPDLPCIYQLWKLTAEKPLKDLTKTEGYIETGWGWVGIQTFATATCTRTQCWNRKLRSAVTLNHFLHSDGCLEDCYCSRKSVVGCLLDCIRSVPPWHLVSCDACGGHVFEKQSRGTDLVDVKAKRTKHSDTTVARSSSFWGRLFGCYFVQL
jgi:hypothetical protein